MCLISHNLSLFPFFSFFSFLFCLKHPVEWDENLFGHVCRCLPWTERPKIAISGSYLVARLNQLQMVQVTFNGKIIANSDKTVVVENNHYFPPDAVNTEGFILSKSDTK
jgi:hypothetical protein